MDLAIITLSYGSARMFCGHAKEPVRMSLGFQDKSELKAAIGVVCTKAVRMAKDRLENKIA